MPSGFSQQQDERSGGMQKPLSLTGTHWDDVPVRCLLLCSDQTAFPGTVALSRRVLPDEWSRSPAPFSSMNLSCFRFPAGGLPRADPPE
jgi:hypothetical protein